MSLVPLLFSDLWENLDRPQHQENDFVISLYPEQLLMPNRMKSNSCPAKRNYYRPWANVLHSSEKTGSSTVLPDKDECHLVLDVQQFKPEELDIKVVDNHVVVIASHNERRDEHGWVSRRFVRKYVVPDQCDVDKISSKLFSDGILIITLPRKEQPSVEMERIITIERTGSPAIQTKLMQSQKQDKEEK